MAPITSSAEHTDVVVDLLRLDLGKARHGTSRSLPGSTGIGLPIGRGRAEETQRPSATDRSAPNARAPTLALAPLSALDERESAARRRRFRSSATARSRSAAGAIRRAMQTDPSTGRNEDLEVGEAERRHRAPSLPRLPEAAGWGSGAARRLLRSTGWAASRITRFAQEGPESRRQ